MTSTGTSFLPGNAGVRLVGGPTALIEMGGLRLLTDPTFDPPGDHPVGNRVLVKTRGPAVAADDVGPVDAVLLTAPTAPRPSPARSPASCCTERGCRRCTSAATTPRWESCSR